jgi:LAO/AO transport system kinase
MDSTNDLDQLVQRALTGEKIPTSRLLSFIERGGERASYILNKMFPYSGNAYYLGITGSPGAGKSSIVHTLVQKFLKDDFTIGVLAVDPSSPFCGGAILGDRIRVHIKEEDAKRVFFRSMSSENILGGLARTTKDAARILDATGKEIVIVETVGVGQSEIDIAQTTDTVLVVVTPESGDSVQIMKAGILEIADIFVVNKADRPGADNISQYLENMLGHIPSKDDWTPPIMLTSASLNKGIDELYTKIREHKEHMQKESRLENRRRKQIGYEFKNQITHQLSGYVMNKLQGKEEFENLLNDIWSRKIDPYNAAQQFIQEMVGSMDQV